MGTGCDSEGAIGWMKGGRLIVLCGAVLCVSVLCCAEVYYAMLSFAMQYCSVLCSAVYCSLSTLTKNTRAAESSTPLHTIT